MYLKLKIKNPSIEYYLKIIPNLNIDKIKDCREFHIIFFIESLNFIFVTKLVSLTTFSLSKFYIRKNIKWQIFLYSF